MNHFGAGRIRSTSWAEIAVNLNAPMTPNPVSMYPTIPFLAVSAAVLASSTGAVAQTSSEVIRLPQAPAISPNGSQIAFEWQDDIWSASINGGEATRLTYYTGRDSAPRFSADGQELYFTSTRSGLSLIHI